MNAKKLLSILAFTLLFCTLLTAFALADSKVVRFDDKGDINLGLNNITPGGVATESIAGNAYRLDIPYSNLKKDVNAQPTFTLPQSEYFNLIDYPYVKFKYRTNFPGNMQLYIKAQGGGYILVQKITENMRLWNTLSIHYPKADGENVIVTTKNQTYKDEDYKIPYPYDYYEYAYNDVSVTTSGPDARAGKIPRFPSEEEPTQIKDFFFQFKTLTDEEIAELQAAKKNLYIEIEYIGFFKTEEEMKAYDSDSYKLFSFNNDKNVSFNYTSTLSTIKEGVSNCLSITDDGVYHIDMYKEDLNDPNQQPNANRKTYEVKFELKEYNYFNLYDYPYAKIKYKSDWNSLTQYYVGHYPNTASGVGTSINGYYLATNKSGAGERINTEVTAEFLYKPETKGTSSDYTAYDNLTWGVGISSGTNNFLPYYTSETDYDLAQVRAPFIQYKGLKTLPKDGGTPATKDYYVDLYYIAYFKDEASMKAFGADETEAVEAAKAAVEALELDYVVESADDIEDMIVADIEAVCEGVDVEVTIDGENVTVHISSFYANRDYTVNKTYTVTEIIPAADFGVAALGAQIRADGIFGLRFGFTIDTAQVPEGCTVTEFGTVIGLAGTTPVIGGENVAKVQAEKIFKTEGTVKTFTAVVTHIPDGTGENEIDQRDTQLVARPYVTYILGTETYTTYGESVTKSVNEVVANAWGK